VINDLGLVLDEVTASAISNIVQECIAVIHGMAVIGHI
jgi:hypothetical protein